MGHRIAIMKDGDLQQCGTPLEVYEQPQNVFVATFIGTPPMNFLEGQIRREDGDLRGYIDQFALKPIPEMESLLAQRDGQTVLVGIRAENMEALNRPTPDALQVEVLVVEPLGSQNLLTIKIGSDIIKVSTHPDFRVGAGQDIWIRFPSEKIRWYDRDSGRALVPDLDRLVS
jgi:multiple sugar transport system ATP-binding protein